MHYDVFISHASEDKDDLVRPLAKALRDRRIEVWYDEFTLAAGASLRRSIDAGLTKSRYGVIVLSPSFFGKAWPEWELNGLVQRHLAGSHNVLLPIWHGVNRDAVAAYSPSLADIVAVRSEEGLDNLVERLLRVIQPEGSALVAARSMILDRGYEPPVISDDWWLDVIERSGYQHGERWFFPIYKMASNRGESLGWTVMQDMWQWQAESEHISQMSKPEDVLAFIRQQPGLMEICHRMPQTMIEFVPQLSIPGFGGELEGAIEVAYQESLKECEARRARNDRFGTALTTDGFCPACDESFVLRHPTFGNYEPAMVANQFVIGGGGGLGPSTRAYEIFDYLIWLLSNESGWLPRRYHGYVLEGMKEWATWPWSDKGYSGKSEGAFHSWLLFDKEKTENGVMPAVATEDLFDRVGHSRTLLMLPESTEGLVDRFLGEDFVGSWHKANDRREIRRKRTKTGSR